jgi:hypothetical protein
VLDRIEHGMVLGRHSHHVPGRIASRHQPPLPRGRAEDREVVALGGAAREHDLTGIRLDRVGKRLPRRIHRPAGLAAHLVRRAAGVAVVVGQPRQHRLEHQRIEPRGRVVVEVDGAQRLGHVLRRVYRRGSRRA